jgi:2-iminobutanoate/2-iminopropanoate deaminase
MLKRVIKSNNAPAPVGPYSQAVWSNNFLFCSGQIPLDAKSGQMVKGSIQEQTKKVMENISEVLKAGNCTFENVVKTTIFLKNMNDFSNVNDVYASYFKNDPPARSTVQVSELPKSADVEIEVIAIVG